MGSGTLGFMLASPTCVYRCSKIHASCLARKVSVESYVRSPPLPEGERDPYVETIINRVISRVTILITNIRGLITPLITTPECRN